jgi:hypothetical protein
MGYLELNECLDRDLGVLEGIIGFEGISNAEITLLTGLRYLLGWVPFLVNEYTCYVDCQALIGYLLHVPP